MLLPWAVRLPAGEWKGLASGKLAFHGTASTAPSFLLCWSHCGKKPVCFRFFLSRLIVTAKVFLTVPCRCGQHHHKQSEDGRVQGSESVKPVRYPSASCLIWNFSAEATFLMLWINTEIMENVRWALTECQAPFWALHMCPGTLPSGRQTLHSVAEDTKTTYCIEHSNNVLFAELGSLRGSGEVCSVLFSSWFFFFYVH